MQVLSVCWWLFQRTAIGMISPAAPKQQERMDII